MFRRVVTIAVWTLLTCVLSYAGMGQAGAGSAKSATGLSLGGKTIDPLAASAGKPAVLIFVRTDCPVSNRYTPTIKSLNQKYEGKASFYLVYPDATETAANIQNHLSEYSLQVAALRDPKHELVKMSQVEITPEAAVFNGKGELVYHGRIDNWYEDFGRARPAPTTHELEDAIVAALSGGPSIASQPAVGCYISDLR